MALEDKPVKITNEVKIRIWGDQSIDSVSKSITDIIAAKASTTEIIEAILSGSLSLGASDIHLEPEKNSTKIRFRLDGLLNDIGSIESSEYAYVVSRIKLLGGLKLNISEAAQDGRFTIFSDDDRTIEVRVSINPSENGETIVLRVLDPKTISLSLDKVGFSKEDEEVVIKTLKRPNGMILVTGPTGSGKTTTLYAFLQAVQNSEVKVITIEDPIEYHLEGIQQTQVDAKVGYDFGNGLRSLLRQDPDIILVGEIRDLETADIAMNASLTGHLVFSTLHTNSAAGAIPRLIDLGVKPQIISPALNIIIAQRLVRRLCDNCKERYTPEGEAKKKLEDFISSLPPRIDRSRYADIALYRPKGCPECRKGYKGRIGIFELLEITKDFEILIHKETAAVELERAAIEKGFISLQQDGILKSLSGITDLDEVERITGPIEW